MILPLLRSPLQKDLLLPGFPMQTDMLFPDFLPQKDGLLPGFPMQTDMLFPDFLSQRDVLLPGFSPEKLCCSMASSPETCAVRWLPFEK
jgi:hypothetical protein